MANHGVVESMETRARRHVCVRLRKGGGLVRVTYTSVECVGCVCVGGGGGGGIDLRNSQPEQLS